MAQLKDSLITGDLRVTGTIYGNATSATALKDRTNNTLTYSNYGAAGLAGSSISWMTCWNGYELRAISKAETFNLVRDNGGNSTWVNVSGDTMTGALNFANDTYNKVGDDAQIGDQNQAGRIAIKGINGNTGIYFAPYSGSTAQSFTIDGAGTATLTGSLSTTNLTLTNTTDATSSTAAGMKTAGGLAVAKKIWLGSGLGASSNNNNSSHLIISSSDTGAGGNVALELWRGTNASWQISNESGNLHFRTNYTTAKQATYSVDAINIAYNTGNTIIKGTVTAPTFIGAVTGHASLDLPLTGGILTGGLEIKGHIAGDAGSSGHGLWGGGGYHNAYNNIILHGDASTGTSGIAFISDKGDTTINQPSDRAFIQWHAHGVTTYTAESTNPTLATSGEANILIIGVGNDATDQIRLQSPAVNGLLHQVGASAYVIPSLNETTTTANHPLISTATAGLYTNNTSITMNGGTITATTFNGNASTATKLQTARTISLTGSVTGSGTFDGSGNLSITTTTNHSHSYLPLTGGTMTGQIKSSKAGGNWIQGRDNACLYQTITTNNNWHPVVGFKTPSGSWTMGNVGDNENCVFSYDTDTNFSAGTNTVMSDIYFNSSGYIYANRVYNAVWNDYAEYRNYNDGETPYGRVVCENGNDSVSLSTKRLQPGAMICSDTFGTSMGEAENTIPIAVAGRVLAYPLEPREEYNFFIGQAVCSGPNGTVSIMTKDEVKEYPECVVGYISAVPKYETWGTGNVKVDGRVWIKVK